MCTASHEQQLNAESMPYEFFLELRQRLSRRTFAMTSGWQAEGMLRIALIIGAVLKGTLVSFLFSWALTVLSAFTSSITLSDTET